VPHSISLVHGDFETRPSRTEQAGTIQLANKYTFVSQLTDLTACLHQRDQGGAQIGVKRMAVCTEN